MSAKAGEISINPVEAPASASLPKSKNTPNKSTANISAASIDGAKVARMQALINLQSEARSAKTENELAHIIANESRNIISARQIFVVRQKKWNTYNVVAVSSLSDVERNSLLIRSMERLVKKLAKSGELDEVQSFQLSELVDVESDDWSSYPFREFLWQPLSDAKADRFAGMLLVREKPWQENELTISAHLGDIYSHAWRAVIGPKRLLPKSKIRALMCWLMVAAIIMHGLGNVPMTALAPAEITARDATVIAAPIDGVVDEILVRPNAQIEAGQPLIRYIDSTLKNDVAVAERRVEIAQARERQFNQGAFDDAQAGQKLNVAASERALAEAELQYAKSQLAKAVVMAPKDGIATFSDPDEWKGRPVKTGLRILRISDPRKVELEVKLPVSDAITLEPGSRIRFFLDSSPLDPIEARLVSGSYEAKQTPSGSLAYTLTGRIEVKDGELPRIGLSGIAQVYGSEVPLFYYLLRKPIVSMRQFFGF